MHEPIRYEGRGGCAHWAPLRTPRSSSATPEFIRGGCNGLDANVYIADAIYLLGVLFLGLGAGGAYGTGVRVISLKYLVLFTVVALVLWRVTGLPPGLELRGLGLLWWLYLVWLAIETTRARGGSHGESWGMGLLIGLTVALPTLPLLGGYNFWDKTGVLPMLPTCALWCIAYASLRTQDRYHLAIQRALPELAGSARTVAESVLARAGLHATSIRVAPLQTFNAAVQGFRRCTVVIDRRASQTLTPEELGAIVAHEAGHAKLLGVWPYLAAFAFVSTGFNLWGQFSGVHDPYDMGPPALLVLPTLWVSMVIFSHALEFHCDRFAARLTRGADLVSALTKIHADMPRLLDRLTRSTWAALYCSHPPLPVRRARLEQRSSRSLVSYRLATLLGCYGLILLPLLICLVVALQGLPRPHWVTTIAHVGSSLYMLGFLIWALTQARAMRPLEQHPLLPRRRAWTRRRVVLALVTTLTLPAAPLLVLSRSTDSLLLLGLAVLTPLFGFLGLLLTRPNRQGEVFLRRWVRTALATAQACLAEGKTDEALAVVDRALARSSQQPWLWLARASCLLNLGRLDEAESALELPLVNAKAHCSALHIQATVAQLRGDLVRAEHLARKLLDACTRQPQSLLLLGWVLAAAGQHAEADPLFQEAGRMQDDEAAVLAYRIVSALEQGTDPATLAPWVEQAHAKDARSPDFLRARARWHLAQGRRDAASDDLREAAVELESRGRPGWIQSLERDAARWGLAIERPLDPAQDENAAFRAANLTHAQPRQGQDS